MLRRERRYWTQRVFFLTAAAAVACLTATPSGVAQAQQTSTQQQPPKIARASAPAASPAPTGKAPVGTPVVAPEADQLAGLPPYLPKSPVKGELILAGSSAMSQMALLWADGLKRIHNEAKIEVKTFESGQVLESLGKNEMQVGLMSRPLTEQELKTGGILAVPTAKDVLGIVVNAANPLDQLSLPQGMALLREPKSAGDHGATTWGELGLKGEWAQAPIHLYGRESGSGAWGYLVNRFLGAGATSRQQTECGSYAELCQKVAQDRSGVGYVSLALGPANPGKVLALATTAGDVVAAPRANEPVDPRYPLVRELFIVFKWKEGQPLSPVANELLQYVLSRSGQEDAVKAGLIPLRRDEVLASRDQLGWTGVR